MDFEFDMNAAGIAALFTLIFGAMVWLVPTWKSISFAMKLFMTILMPFLFYIVALYMVNR